MPYIDESPTMSPQLSARGQDSGDGVSPTPTDGLGTGVGGLGAGGCEIQGWGCPAGRGLRCWRWSGGAVTSVDVPSAS